MYHGQTMIITFFFSSLSLRRVSLSTNFTTVRSPSQTSAKTWEKAHLVCPAGTLTTFPYKLFHYGTVQETKRFSYSFSILTIHYCPAYSQKFLKPKFVSVVSVSVESRRRSAGLRVRSLCTHCHAWRRLHTKTICTIACFLFCGKNTRKTLIRLWRSGVHILLAMQSILRDH